MNALLRRTRLEGRSPRPGRGPLRPLALALLALAAFPAPGRSLSAVPLVGQSTGVGAERPPVEVAARSSEIPGPNRRPLDIHVLPDGFLYRVVLSDGPARYGRIASGGDPVRLGLAHGGVEELPRSEIVRIEQVRGAIVDEEFWPEDPNHTRLIFAPTGRNLPRGSGSVNAYYGVMPFLAVGVTDRLTVAGGTSLIRREELSLFPSKTPVVPSEEAARSAGRLVHLAPKLQVLRTRRLETAVGALVFVGTGDLSVSTGMGYAVSTWSPNPRTGLTAGAGLGILQGRWDSTPAWMVGGDRRMSRRLKLLGEAYRFPGGQAVGIGGIRVLRERASADIGLAVHAGEDSHRAFPVFNVSWGW